MPDRGETAGPAGEVRVVDDVAAAFVDLVKVAAPGTFALSGGETARRCYERLAQSGFGALDWPAVEILFGDERWVAVDHADSNEGMARAALLSRMPVGIVHSAREAGPTVEEAADAYDALVAGLGPIDVVHLGLGDDGHTASLFSGSPALDERERRVVATGDDDHPHARLTFTFPAIAASRLAVVTVEGEAKHDIWARVQAGDDVPATRLTAQRLVWLVDRAAAG